MNGEHEKQTREGENEAFEKCRKIAFHLFFSLSTLFKEQGEEIDCRSETFNGVVAARVVITCLNRHILCFQKSSFFVLMSREIKERHEESQEKRECIGEKERLLTFDCLT